MKEAIDPTQILEQAYRQATEEVIKDDGSSSLNALNKEQREWLVRIADKCESQKAVVSALTASLVKKIETPEQDVRMHKMELKGGYSGRTFDTNYVTPFFKAKFRRLAMQESGWLTRSIEQAHAFTLDFPGKIRDENVKQSFLQILNDVEVNKADPQGYLIGLFVLLIQQMAGTPIKFNAGISQKTVAIESIIKSLKSHFFREYNVRGASRLPVIAVYSIYQTLMNDVTRYQGKKLQPLRSHLAPDARSNAIGDIEVIGEDSKYFEAVEIKHGISINSEMIEGAYQKFRDTPITRYYLLTTAAPDIQSGEEEQVRSLIAKIRKEHGCEVIVNGIIPSLKYYLRLLPNPVNFVEKYTDNLYAEFSKTTEIKKQHLAEWERIIKELEI
jgi:DNA (cytosine-5)-methyltransferase 1